MFDINGKKIIQKLKIAGFNAYFVGGAVRDNIIGKEVYDYDITTNARPDDIINVFKGHKLVLKGLKHGTVGVILSGKLYEITTFRIDGDYKDNRHPNIVTFSDDLKQDIMRRDFTINAIASDGYGKFIDYLGGIDDINNKIIRTCGDPKIRFSEDGLRILRAMRFEAQLGFDIEENTRKAMVECAYLLKNISVERIYSELSKTLTGEYASKALKNNAKVLFTVIPELEPLYNLDQNSLSHNLDAFSHTLKVISLTKCDPILRWTALLHDSGKAHTYTLGRDGYGHFYGHMNYSKKIAIEVLSRLKAPKVFTKTVADICSVHDETLIDKYSIKKLLHNFGKQTFEYLLEFRRADLYSHSEYGINKYKQKNDTTERLYHEIIAGGECYNFSDLKINGRTLLETGIRGKYSEILGDVFDGVISGKLENDKDVLIDYVKHKFAQNT